MNDVNHFASERAWIDANGRGPVAYIAYTFRFPEIHRKFFERLSSWFCYSEVVLGRCNDSADRVRIFRVQTRCN